MARIGPILSIIFPAASTDVHPAVFLGLPFSLNPEPSLYSYMYSLLFFVYSSITTKTYLGFSVGKIDASVLILVLEYMLLFTCSAVPVLPPT